MTTGPKILLGSAGILVLAAGIEIAIIHHRNEEVLNAPTPTANEPKMSDDDLVFRKSRHPDSLKDERELVGTTIWVAAGGQLNYYRDVAGHVDYHKPVDTLPTVEPLLVQGVFEQVSPTNVVQRIPTGKKQVLLAFTMPKSADPKALYATPVGDFEDGVYELLDDQIFYYDDPHQLYKHWGAEAWSHVDKHEAAVGMTEMQVMFALGQVMDPHGETQGERSITFYNDGKPITVEFSGGKAVKITAEKTS